MGPRRQLGQTLDTRESRLNRTATFINLRKFEIEHTNAPRAIYGYLAKFSGLASSGPLGILNQSWRNIETRLLALDCLCGLISHAEVLPRFSNLYDLHRGKAIREVLGQ